MWVAAPQLEGARQNRDQWMLGDDVLVAPVIEQGATSRSVLFPDGCWQREGTGETVTGPQRTDVAASLDQLPWYVRCGTQPLGVAPASAQAPAAGPAVTSTTAAAPAAAPAAARSARSLPATGLAAPTALLALLLLGAAVACGGPADSVTEPVLSNCTADATVVIRLTPGGLRSCPL
jgi:hypothetical protein